MIFSNLDDIKRIGGITKTDRSETRQLISGISYVIYWWM